jgi:hypothetical protein
MFIHHLFSLITGIKTNMLLIIFLGLIAKLTSVSGECLGTQDIKVFDWNKVGINTDTRFLKLTAVKTTVCVYISSVVPLKNFQ